MTHRENFEKMFNHEVMDYIPHLGTDAVNFRDFPFSRQINKTGLDGWGCRWISCKDSLNITHPDTTDIKFSEISQWREKVVFPDLDKMDCSQMYDTLKDYTDEVRKEKMLVYVSTIGIFERSHSLMGFENALCEMMEDPDEFSEMLGAFTDFQIRLYQKIYDMFQPDVLMYHDDMGSQQSPFFPTWIFVDYIFPHYKRLVKEIKKIGYKYVVHHSCGKVDTLIPEWLECGFDGWDSVMPCNDLRELKHLYGDRIVFWPGGDAQNILGIDGIGEEKIENMVLEYYDMLASDGKGLCMDTTTAYSLNPANEEICLQMQKKHQKAFIDAVKANKHYEPKD